MSLLQFLNNGYFAGKVGIGTDSPSYKFTTYGSSVDSEIVASFGSANDQNEYTAIGLSGFIASNGATKAGLALKRTGVYGTGELHFLNNNTLDNSDMTLSDSKMMIDSSGNVGIGTTSPQSKLDVKLANNSTANIGGTISVGAFAGLSFGYSEVGNSNYRHSAIVFERDDAAFGDARGKVHILNSPSGSTSADLGDARLTILPDGNVGIGTTNPSSQLSIGSNVITTKKPTVVIADGVAGGSLVIRGLSPILSFDRTGADPQNKILMDTAGLEFKTGTLDAEGDVDFKINPDGDLQLSKGAKISNQENTDIDSAAAEVVAQVAISYTAAFFDFVIKKTTNVRSGTVYACHDGTNVEFTETSTNDLGDTSDVTLSVDISGTNMRLLATVTSDDWSVKSLIRAI